jgi:hypothetical protein
VIAAAGLAPAATRTLDDTQSPIKVQFDDATARLSFAVKATGALWSNPASGGGDELIVGETTQPDQLHLTAAVKTKAGVSLNLVLTLEPSTGDLTVAIGGEPATDLGRGLQYPYAFFPQDGSGYAIIPMFGGYAVPTTQTDWQAPWSHARMEWFGGVDQRFGSGWMFIAEPAADMQMTVSAGSVNGQGRLGGSFRWLGSNANATTAPNRLSYERKAVLRYFSTGGYVAQAKHFRAYAQRQGWFRSLKDKAAVNPQVADLIGAPVIYLWGDGRSTRMLDAMKQAGIEKALIQLSINHVDHNGAFPNREFADGEGWSKTVRAHGYVPGIYDIYAMARGAGGGPGMGRGAAKKTAPTPVKSADSTIPPRGGSPPGGLKYSGFTYLFPTNVAEWNYVNAEGQTGGRGGICHQMSAQFARETRLPQHIRQFGLDAFFFDTVCALEPRECFDTNHRHAATRAKDIVNRQTILDAATGRFNKITGTEQLKSWAVPFTHWAEGMFKLGMPNARGQIGAWNNNAYPEVMVDVQDIGDRLNTELTTGFQVPLWELVYHDAVISVQHWHLVHNKLLYCWDLADQFALIRGQSPILNLVYAGEKGSVGREIQGATDVRDGKVWDSRWTTPHVAARVLQTYNTVSRWQAKVAYLEMINHRLLTGDFAVQLTEFSADGGRTGRGIVVNFGTFDGARSMAGPAWSGTVRGQALTVPVGSSAEFEW